MSGFRGYTAKAAVMQQPLLGNGFNDWKQQHSKGVLCAVRAEML
jgi:hypothetical protein